MLLPKVAARAQAQAERPGLEALRLKAFPARSLTSSLAWSFERAAPWRDTVGQPQSDHTRGYASLRRHPVSGGRSGEVTDAENLVHVLVAVALTYALGFERDVRGSAAGDRVFALIGVAAGLAGVFAVEGRRMRCRAC